MKRTTIKDDINAQHACNYLSCRPVRRSMNIKKIIDPSHPRSTFKPTYHVQPLDPDLRKTEHRSAQAAPRPRTDQTADSENRERRGAGKALADEG